MPVDMEKTDAQSELQAIRNFEMRTSLDPGLHMNAPLTHDVVTNKGCLNTGHVEVQGFEYGIVHVFLTLRDSISPGMLIDMRTHASPF